MIVISKIKIDDKKNQEEISKKISELEKKVEELNEKYLRSLADYQNLERQTNTWREEFVKFSNQGLIVQLLEVLDDLEKADHHLHDDGLKLIVEKMKGILKNGGLEEADLENSDFDPNLCEAVGVTPGEENHKVVEIKQKGYKLYGRVIRPAKVIVSQS